MAPSPVRGAGRGLGRDRGQPRALLDGVSILPHRLSTIRSCRQIIVRLQYVGFNRFATGDIEAGQMNA